MGLTEDRRMGELAEQLVDFRQGTGLRNSPTKNFVSARSNGPR